MNPLLKLFRPKPHKPTFVTYRTKRARGHRKKVRAVCDQLRQEQGLEPVKWERMEAGVQS